jgi:site-specific DNA recombinase
MKTAAYIRVSTEEQRIHGLSVDTQKAVLTEYALKNNLDIIGYYIDAGLTARKKLSQRRELLRLLDDVEKGEVELIIFTKLDRWFRNIADYYRVQEKLDQYRVDWRTIYENYDTATASGRLHINIMLSIAQDEADRTSERIKAVFENKRARGETPANKAPLGYRIENSKLRIDEATKQIALDIFRHYDIHHSVMGCVRMVRERHNYTIYDYSIRRMLENRIYIGEFRGHRGFCEPLVEYDLFDRIQRCREVRVYRNQLANGRVYLFSSLIYCKECGRIMSACSTAQKQKPRPREYHYYRCKEAVNHHRCLHCRRINETVLEEYLLNLLVPELEQKIILREQKVNAGKDYKTSAANIKKRMERLKDLYLDDLLNKDTYRQEYSALTEQLTSTEAALAKSPRKSGQITVIKLGAVYSSMSLRERKAFWLGIIDRIIIDRENAIDFYFKP